MATEEKREAIKEVDIIAQITKNLMEGGWSSVYAFVERHISDDDINYYMEDYEDE